MRLFGFLRQRDGNIAVMAGLLLFPLAMAAGFAVDHTRAASLKIKSQNAADAAALAIVSRHIDNTRAAQSYAEAFIETAFQKDRIKNIETKAILNNGAVTVDVSLDLKPYFFQIGKLPDLHTNVRAVAGTARPQLDVYLLLDRSASLLIGDTQQDIEDMMALTKPMIRALDPSDWRYNSEPEGCAFACHATEGWETDGKSIYEHAMEMGIGLRADRIASAGESLISGILQETGGTTRIGVVNFTNTAETVLEATTDRDAIRAAIRDDDGWGEIGWARTEYGALFDYLNAEFATQGDGTATKPETMFVLVTDGVYNHYGPSFSNSNQPPPQAFPGELCETLLDRGFGMAVVRTKYDQLQNSWRYDDQIPPIIDQVAGNLESCAPDGYFES